MGLKELAEGIILQCMEDLAEEALRPESIEFFKGKGFSACAQIAGLNIADRMDLLHFVNTLIESGRKHGREKSKPTRRTLERPERAISRH
jgi:hypothetical protein